MKQKLKQSKGITLVSLVVTIIVLIILAGISLALIFGENGIVGRAKEAKAVTSVATAQENLELVKGSVLLEKYSVNLDDYLEELDKVREKYEVNDVKRIDNDNAEIIIGGKYKFIATDEKNGNVKITYQGEVGKTVGLEISPTSGTYVYPTTGTFEVVKNISGGELSVKSENENIAKASISGTTVTVEPQNMAGTVKIIVTSSAKGEYAEQKAVYKATVENGTISLEATAYTGNYDGSDHDAVSNIKVTPTDATVEYSIDGGAFSTTIPKVNGANTYSVSIRASKAGYATKTITKTITVGKNTQTGNLTLSATSGTITYPTVGTFTVTKNTSGGALSVTSSDTSVATATISGTTVTITPKAISEDGKQTTITVTSAATSNYEEQKQTYIATVNMGTITLSADAYTGNYDGSEHDAVSNVKVTPTDATVEYSIDGGAFSSTIPKVNGANTYSVSIRASKAGYATKTITKTITIIKNTQTVSEVKGGSYFDKEITLEDSNGNKIKVPQGFKIAEDSGINVTEGIVIEDNDIIDGVGNNRGNQYVWIPVGTGIKKADGTTVDITLGRYTFADGTSDKDSNETVLAKGTPILKQNADNYTQEVVISSYYKELAISRTGVARDDANGLNTTALNLKGFVDSVKTNGGYYIARYEASYGTDGKANSKVSNSFTDSFTAPKTRTEGMLWNWITQIDSATASRNIYTTATTDLINSYAWDTAIVYIQNFSGDADYSRQDGESINSSLTNTGANGDEVCKINDMASNASEWTTEYSTAVYSSIASPCSFRGGCCYGSNFYTSHRYDYYAKGSNKDITFRPTLYM